MPAGISLHDLNIAANAATGAKILRTLGAVQRMLAKLDYALLSMAWKSLLSPDLATGASPWGGRHDGGKHILNLGAYFVETWRQRCGQAPAVVLRSVVAGIAI
jgi:hypothetical protein